MDTVKFVPMLLGLLITVVMVGAVFVPVVASSTTQTITTEIENDGAGWLKLGYNEGEDYSFNVGFDESDNFNVGTQTGTYGDMICYADSERTLFISGDNWYLLTNGETPSVHKFTNTATVSNASGTLTINDGSTVIYSGASPSWAYVPDSSGVYGFFTEGGLNLEEGKPKVAVGSFANVFAYNDTVVAPDDLGTLGLTMSGDYAENEVIWTVAPSELDSPNLVPNDSLVPAVIDLDPAIIQPIDLGGGSQVGLMSADPTTGTRVGDLYYTFSGSEASVIGYSSSIDWSTFTSIPDTVTSGGVTYTVTTIDRGSFSGCTNLALTSLPSGLTTINQSAFYGCTNLALTSLPSGVTSVGASVFSGCTNLALTSLPDGLTSIGGDAFKNCTNLALTSLPDGLTTLSYGVFSGCTNLALTSLPDGLTSMGTNVFRDCTNLALTSLPSGLTVIDMYDFQNCVNLDIKSIPIAVTSINSYSFTGCTNLKSLIFEGSPTIGNTAFNGCTNLKQILNLGETEITTTSYGLNADSVQDHVTALGYIAPVSIHETEVIPIDSPTAKLLSILPLIAGVGALLLAVSMMIYTRY